MKLKELKATLARHPEAHLRFRLPNGDFVPAHAHVTEVARIEKRFIDCGGTLRNESLCRLQTWTADDFDHRLTAGKLLTILSKASSFLETDDIDVDVEHQLQFISQFPLEAIEVHDWQLVLALGERHTACLALDKCLPQKPQTLVFKPLPTFQ